MKKQLLMLIALFSIFIETLEARYRSSSRSSRSSSRGRGSRSRASGNKKNKNPKYTTQDLYITNASDSKISVHAKAKHKNKSKKTRHNEKKLEIEPTETGKFHYKGHIQKFNIKQSDGGNAEWQKMEKQVKKLIKVKRPDKKTINITVNGNSTGQFNLVTTESENQAAADQIAEELEAIAVDQAAAEEQTPVEYQAPVDLAYRVAQEVEMFFYNKVIDLGDDGYLAKSIGRAARDAFEQAINAGGSIERSKQLASGEANKLIAEMPSQTIYEEAHQANTPHQVSGAH